MKYSDLRGIIEFIYHGEVSIDQSSLSSFLQAAESLKIRGIYLRERLKFIVFVFI